MGSVVSPEMLSKIVNETNIDANFQRGKDLASQMPTAPFSGVQIAEFGIQRDHVSLEAMGAPGAWLEKYPDIAGNVFDGTEPNCQAITALCSILGYQKAIK
jgi:hypothetical protein